MARKITDEQMRNLMSHILFGTKRDANRSYKNMLWFLSNIKGRSITEEDLKKALDFELQGYQRTDDGEEVIFLINKDYTTTPFSMENYQEGLDLFHQKLMETASWYRALLQ